MIAAGCDRPRLVAKKLVIDASFFVGRASSVGEEMSGCKRATPQGNAALVLRRFAQEGSGVARERNIAASTYSASMFRSCATSEGPLGSAPARAPRQTSWEDPNDLEDSEDCRGAGGHGNQHVRLRSAQIDCIETICPALAALRCFEPRQTSDLQTSGSRFSGSRFQDTASRLTRLPPDFKASSANHRIPQTPLHRKPAEAPTLFRLWQKKRCHSIPH